MNYESRPKNSEWMFVARISETVWAFDVTFQVPHGPPEVNTQRICRVNTREFALLTTELRAARFGKINTGDEVLSIRDQNK